MDLYKMGKKAVEIQEIPKPQIRKRHRKGDALPKPTEEQIEQLRSVDISMHIEFVFGTPKTSPVKEFPRQETPYARAKRTHPGAQLGANTSARKLAF
jgi:hypothetical protein